ncbi:MAG: HAD family hydrolase [Planctomycetaceae bacterium]|jgi:putative hydrolase of the HAD superfamily|nr:HAD family hydrolase [Planctomycetaceae bacterium]
MQQITVIGFDADDTLWSTESFFYEAEERFLRVVGEFGEYEPLKRIMFDVILENLGDYGYGVKSFTLSLIDAALRIGGGNIQPKQIREILDIGRWLVRFPIELLSGVTDTLEKLRHRYRLIIVTKGDLLDQQRKLDKSGLANYFDHVEVLIQKTPADYQKLVTYLGIKPEQFLMIGNSVKSDIIPVLEIGGYGVYVPFPVMWEHEIASPPYGHPRFNEISNIAGILPLLGV